VRSDSRVRLIDVAARKVIRAVALQGVRFEEDLTADGKLLVVPSAALRAHVIPLDPRHKEWEVPVPDVWSFSVFPDGRRIAVKDHCSVIRIHDLRTGERLDTHSLYRGALSVQMIGKDTAASWTRCEKLLTWDIRTGKVLSEASMRSFSPTRFSADGKHVAGWTKGGGMIAETRTGKVLFRFEGNPEGTAIDFHPTGDAVWSAAMDGEQLLRIKLRTPSGVRSDRICALSTSWQPRNRFSPDGRFVLHAAGSLATLYETATGKPRWEKNWHLPEKLSDASPPSFEITFDRKGRTVVVARPDFGDATVFDVLTGRRLAILPEAGNDPVLSGSGRWLACNYRTEIVLWDLHARHPTEPSFKITLPQPAPVMMELDEDGSRLITSYADGTCLVWDLSALRARKTALDEWELLRSDAPREAMASLVEQPTRTVRLLESKLVPVPSVPREKIAEWIAQLDAKLFAERAAAETRLGECLDQAEGAMRLAEKSATPEAARRLRRLLSRLEDREADPEWLRLIRAIEVLERIDSSEAVALLEKLAKGASGASLTREAAQALARLR
jgi:WD40 repeat protein